MIDLLKSNLALPNHPSWKNTHIKGVRVRTGLGDVETGDGVYNDAYIDSAVTEAKASGKLLGVSISVLANPPKWLTDLKVKTVTLTDGTVVVLPNDPTFQRVLKALLLHVASKHDGDFYFVASGLGQPASESYMARSDSDAAIYAAAGFDATEWKATCNVIIGYHFAALKNTKVIFTAAKPFPDGINALKDEINALMPLYPNLGMMNSGLNSHTNSGDVIAGLIKTYAPTHPCGFQMVGNSSDSRLGGLQAAIDAGESVLGTKGGFIEIYDADCTSTNAAMLDAANTKLGATTQ